MALSSDQSIWAELRRAARAPAEADFMRQEVGEDVFQRNDLAFQELDALQAVLDDMAADDASGCGTT